MRKKQTEYIGICVKGRNGHMQVRPVSGGDAIPLDEGDFCPFPGDTVAFVMVRKKGRFQGICREVMKREHVRFTGKVGRAGQIPYVEPQEGLFEGPVRLDSVPNGVREGILVAARVKKWPHRGVDMLCEVEAVLGDPDSPAALLRGIAAEHGFCPYPERDWLADMGDDEARQDLRELVCFTIDGEDAKDFDDAVSLSVENGHSILGVHIADVSHYVRPHTPLDEQARSRGTSLYLPGYTLPMLPEILCNDLCSLKEGEDRRTMSLLMDMESGEARLCPAWIRSRKRLTYTQVNRLFAGEESGVPEEVRESLLSMRDLANELRARRVHRGSVDFDLPEIAFDLDETGTPVAFHARRQGEAEKLIEDFMLLANQKIAEKARQEKLPFVYRVHEKPDGEKLRSMQPLLEALDIRFKIGGDPAPKKLQRLLAEAEEKGKTGAVAPALLRCMQRARYSEKPLGHYALALEDYCHFTSPIRRYPDLLVHRALKDAALLAGEDMKALAEETSRLEYEAVLAEREADDLCACFALRGREGETFESTVSGVSRGAFFVRLEGGAEGCVPYRLLEGYVQSDETLTRVLLPHRQVLTLGDKVQVRLLRVDIPRKEITLDMDFI